MFREPPGFLDVIVGFGPRNQTMDWLYALTIETRPDWDREWLLTRLQAVVPLTKRGRLTWSLHVQQHYWWDVDESVGHEFVVRLTDPLVPRLHLDDVITNVQRLFVDVERELAHPLSIPAHRSSGLTPAQLAYSHLGGPPPASGVSPHGFSVETPAFAEIERSVRLARDDV